MTFKKKRILIGYSFWGSGGAEIASMWIIEAIKKDFDVHLLTRGGFDIEALNELSGTNLLPNEITVLPVPSNTNNRWFGHVFFLRYCRKVAKNFNLCITASRTIDWGMPAIHFLSDVAWNNQLKEKFREEETQWDKNSPAKKLLDYIRYLFIGKSRRSLLENDYFVANSKWTQKISSHFVKNSPKVIYPAVKNIENNIDWKNRQNRFICLGRISPEKRIEDIISIIEKVREQGKDIKLDIIGKFDNTNYSRFIHSACTKRKEWIIIRGELIADKKNRFLSESKFGINSCKREAFGISTAEMVKAGMIPFVPIEGAQQEIVPLDELIFTDKDDAVKKIIVLLDNEQKQLEKLRKLKKKSCDFSPEQFCKETKEYVMKILDCQFKN